MATYDKERVKEQLEIENILDLLEFFDAQPQMMDDYIIARTICHNGDTHKLYFYENTKLFKCYSGDCGSFDVFELIQKIQDISLNDAVYFIVNFFNLYSLVPGEEFSQEERECFESFDRWGKIDRPKKEKQKLIFPEIPNYIKNYPDPIIGNWEREGITREVCEYMGIRYDPVYGCILIPHKDENDRLIGIRQRTLVQEDEQYGKYRPAKIQGNLCNHPLAFNLYGLNTAKENISKLGRVVVAESEKSVLLYMSYYGIINNICVAVCGSSLSRYQADLLRSYGAKEFIIAFDKDFQELDTPEHHQSNNKRYTIYKKFGAEVDISFLYDKTGEYLGYKDSPLDCGKETFEILRNNRVVIKDEDCR